MDAVGRIPSCYVARQVSTLVGVARNVHGGVAVAVLHCSRELFPFLSTDCFSESRLQQLQPRHLFLLFYSIAGVITYLDASISLLAFCESYDRA